MDRNAGLVFNLRVQIKYCTDAMKISRANVKEVEMKKSGFSFTIFLRLFPQDFKDYIELKV